MQGQGGGRGGSAPLRGWGQDLGHSSSLCRLQLLKAETDALVLLVSAAFPEPGDSPQHLAPHQRLRSHQEMWLCQQIRFMAASIQVGPSTASGLCATAAAPGASGCHAPSPALLGEVPQRGGSGLARPGAGLRSPSSPRSAPQQFAGEVLKMFSTDCKRMSAEIFDQTMPLGKHWRVSLRAGG